MRRFTDSTTSLLFLAVVTLAMAPGPSGAQSHEDWVDVQSVRVDANGLIVIVCRGVGDASFADGSYKSRDSEISSKGGTIVSMGSGDQQYGVEEVTMGRDGNLVLHSVQTAGDKASPNLLPPGEYRFDGERGDDATRTPVVTGFRVRKGGVVAAVLIQ